MNSIVLKSIYLVKSYNFFLLLIYRMFITYTFSTKMNILLKKALFYVFRLVQTYREKINLKIISKLGLFYQQLSNLMILNFVFSFTFSSQIK